MSKLAKDFSPYLSLFVVLAALPFVLPSNYFLDVAINAGIIIALALAFDLVIGRIGALSFAQPVFLGFGAYAAALIATNSGGGFWLEVAVAAVGALILALLIGIPAFRLNLHAFAIGTIGFVTIAQLIALNWSEVTGGPMCIAGIPPADLNLGFGPLRPRGLFQQYYFILGIVVATFIVVALVVRQRLGLAFTAVRDDAVLAKSQGLFPLRIQLIAFGASAILSAVAGVFMAHFQTVVCPESMAMSYTITLIIIAFVGGRGSFRGILLAAAIITVAPEAMRMAEEWRLALFGILMLAIVLSFPDGLEHLFQFIERKLFKRGAASNEPPAALVVNPRTPEELDADARVLVGDTKGGALSIRRLTKAYGGVVAVKDFSLDVAPGELVGLIGPNGSGKSTTIDCISGISTPNAGQVLLDGIDISGWPTNRLAKDGMVRTFQATRTYTSLNARENLMVGALARAPLRGEVAQYLKSPDKWPEISERIAYLIKIFNLGHVETRKLGELSYGQRKLVQFAATLVIPPRIILLDEPLAGVNPTIANFFKEQIQALNRHGMTVVLVEHNLEVVTSISTRLVVIDRGQKIADGIPSEVINNPQVQEAYLGK